MPARPLPLTLSPTHCPLHQNVRPGEPVHNPTVQRPRFPLIRGGVGVVVIGGIFVAAGIEIGTSLFYAWWFGIRVLGVTLKDNTTNN